MKHEILQVCAKLHFFVFKLFKNIISNFVIKQILAINILN